MGCFSERITPFETASLLLVEWPSLSNEIIDAVITKEQVINCLNKCKANIAADPEKNACQALSNTLFAWQLLVFSML